MQVILLEDVKSLGRKGDVVEVSEGYARNFLFPAHYAIEANPKTLSDKQDAEKREKGKEKKQEREDKKMASQLDGVEVVVKAKAEKGKLYAAVGPKQVRDALKDMGHKIDEEQVEMTPMKETGSQEIIINFATGYEATITVVVEA